MQPIGIFDSGLGGLSVLQAVRQLLPAEPLVYLADQARVPYGPRPCAEVCAFAEQVTRFLLVHEARLVVVACNTASACALEHLRREFPKLLFVGMEPAVKPAVESSIRKVVAVLATAATFSSARYASLVQRYGSRAQVLQDACSGWVELVEAGTTDTPQAHAVVRAVLQPLLAAGADTLVLGCTHFTFLKKAISECAGAGVAIVDPAPAVARRVQALLSPPEPQPAMPGSVRVYSTGLQRDTLQRAASVALGRAVAVERVVLV